LVGSMQGDMISFTRQSSIFIFFFQAEDGIRDRNVTGVQTCALPISHQSGIAIGARFMSLVLALLSTKVDVSSRSRGLARSVLRRSEERRVGKECRSGWGPAH